VDSHKHSTEKQIALKEQAQQSTSELSGGSRRRSLRDLISVIGPALLLTIAGFVLAWQFVEPAPPKHLAMAVGPMDSAYYRFGLRYRDFLARYGIELNLVNTAGSVENLALLMDPDSDVEVALLQGGIATRGEAPDLKGLVSLFYEPLWIFQREESTPGIKIGFEGLRVAVGPAGSGTQHAVRRLIENYGTPDTAFQAVEIGGSAAAEALLEGRVDVACFVAHWDAPYIQRLLLSDGIYPGSVLRAEAYIRHNHSLASVVLPRGTADLRRDIPQTDIQMLAPVASLTAKKSLHPTLIAVLIQAVVEVHSDGGIFEQQGQFPSMRNMTLPAHEDARRYLENGPPWLQRYLPFWIAVSADRLLILLIPLATLLIPLFKIAPPTYRWRIRKRIYSYYRNLIEVESILQDVPSLKVLDQCQARIQKIEEELVELSVPLSYADQLYHLRMHVRFVKQRLELARSDPG
jgi:hypothetical protein